MGMLGSGMLNRRAQAVRHCRSMHPGMRAGRHMTPHLQSAEDTVVHMTQQGAKVLCVEQAPESLELPQVSHAPTHTHPLLQCRHPEVDHPGPAKRSVRSVSRNIVAHCVLEVSTMQATRTSLLEFKLLEAASLAR